MTGDGGRGAEFVGRVPPSLIDRLGDHGGARAGLLVLVQALVAEVAAARGESVTDVAQRLRETCRESIIDHFTGDEAEYATFTRAPTATKFVDDLLAEMAGAPPPLTPLR